MIERLEIAELIPHAGSMCLLDRVISWDETAIQCGTMRHLDHENPLRRNGRLGGLCGVEFAAQAMAVHGRLAGDTRSRPRTGFLVSIRDVICRCSRLDLVDGELVAAAERMMGEDERVTYRFNLRCRAVELMAGRATVVLNAGAP
jgi:predicted hotdog family 3-hydroxylacyl-ACP dehydratase